MIRTTEGSSLIPETKAFVRGARTLPFATFDLDSPFTYGRSCTRFVAQSQSKMLLWGGEALSASLADSRAVVSHERQTRVEEAEG